MRFYQSTIHRHEADGIAATITRQKSATTRKSKYNFLLQFVCTEKMAKDGVLS
jgi:hypothetical protein